MISGTPKANPIYIVRSANVVTVKDVNEDLKRKVQ